MEKNILIFNVGSSSCKFQLYTEDFEFKGKGLLEKIGIDGTNIKYVDSEGQKWTKEENITFEEINQFLMNFFNENQLIDWDNVSAMVHRVVHGAEVFTQDCRFTAKEEVEMLKKLNGFAPLHNPYNIKVLEAMLEQFPNIPQIGIFDTSFHSTIPQENFLYSVPYKWYEKNGVRKYGFHGSSHGYITETLSNHLDKKANLISIHLGNGSSIAAVKNGLSINTTMGLTPLPGLIMGTRAGDFDPSIIFHMVNQEGMSIEEVEKHLQKNSGLLGISELSSDMRGIIEGIEDGNEKAKLAFDMTAQRIADYVIQYANLVGSDELDGIVFTAGIGENCKDIIIKIVEKINIKKLSLKDEFNNKEKVNLVSKEDSDWPIYIIPTNEELYMAQKAMQIIGGK